MKEIKMTAEGVVSDANEHRIRKQQILKCFTDL
jgi:hypothetical protein